LKVRARVARAFICLLLGQSFHLGLAAWVYLSPKPTTMYQQEGPITQWALEDRPREKLMKRGIAALTDAELLAVLLRSGTKDQSAIQLARHILDQNGGIDLLARSSVSNLCQIKGIGVAKAISIVAAFELGRRKEAYSPVRVRVTASHVAAQYLNPKLVDEHQEIFYVLFLNRNLEVISEKRVFQGGVSATVIDPKIVFQEAMLHLASGIVVAHNHPSGNFHPSDADLKITRKLVKAGKMLDIRVMDHLIISHKGYYSFADEGVLGGINDES